MGGWGLQCPPDLVAPRLLAFPDWDLLPVIAPEPGFKINTVNVPLSAHAPISALPPISELKLI